MTTYGPSPDKRPGLQGAGMPLTDFPGTTLRRVIHIARLVSGAIPVENSSINTTSGLPRDLQHVSTHRETDSPTHESNGQCQLTLVTPRQLAGQSVGVDSKCSRL